MSDARINNLTQVCSVKALKYVGGREGGLNILLVQNGRLCFEVLVDKAMDIGQLTHRGDNISLVTANGLCAFESGFDEVFGGGLVYTCGLDTVGGRKLPVHGKFHNIPARVLSVKADEKGAEIVGEIFQTSLFGDKLKVIRTIKTGVNSGAVEIADEIVNAGYTDAEYCIMYHTNLGYPMLDDGVKIAMDCQKSAPRTEAAARHMADAFTFEAPVAGEEERVYFHTVKSGRAEVINKKLKKKFTLTYDEKKLPHLIEWKSLASGAYALGLEPSTTTLDDGFIMNKLRAGESVRTGVRIEIEDIN